MEKVSLNKNYVIIPVIVLCVMAALSANSIQAGVVMAPPQAPPELNAEGEAYADSTFGEAPAKTHPDSNMAADRSPAGLEFNKTSTRVKPTPVEARSDMGASPNSEIKDPVMENLISSRKGVQEVSLIAGDLGFFPKTVFVTRDIPVRLYITGASKNTLCIMMDSFQVRKQLRSQKIEEITFTPGTSGKYRFYCPVNGSEGTMVVRETLAASQ